MSSSDPGYIELPLNISKLNEYMCDQRTEKASFAQNAPKDLEPPSLQLNTRVQTVPISYGISLYIMAEIVPLISILYIN